MRKILMNIAAAGFAAVIAAGTAPINMAYAGGASSQARAPARPAFSDVPADSWAAASIRSAAESGLMNGVGGGLFGYGRTITRAEFVTVLCNMFGWEAAAPEKPTFSDVSPGEWFYGYVEAAAAHGAAAAPKGNGGNGAFSPNTAILRKDMAVMLVKALGYDALAGQVTKTEATPFDDVDSDQGYIIIAGDIGMIGGVGGGKFAPDNTAKREEAAAMLTRVYARLSAPLTWLHGFYAFSSYGQRELIKDADAVTFGWSALKWSAATGTSLETSGGGGAQWRIPDSYELIADYPRENGVKANLGVYMDAAAGLYGMLADEKAASAAADAIIAEATRVYEAVGRSPYDGVTIDFEGLAGPDAKSEFTAFLSKLAEGLKARGLALYVAVQPMAADRQSFDGYDYRKIGQIADKVILMAHDYEPVSMDGFVGTDWQKNAALTPISEVYQALKAITDAGVGVEDKGKIALAFSFSCVGWMIGDDGKLTSPAPVTPTPDTVYTRMTQPDTVPGWSDAYRNPYMIYATEDGQKIYMWYEDGRSVAEKLKLARLFGVTGASVWRLGIVPVYGDWNVWANFAKY